MVGAALLCELDTTLLLLEAGPLDTTEDDAATLVDVVNGADEAGEEVSV